MAKINALSHTLEHFRSLDEYYKFKSYDDISSIVKKLGGQCYFVGGDLHESNSCSWYVDTYYVDNVDANVFFNFYGNDRIVSQKNREVKDGQGRKVAVEFLNESALAIEMIALSQLFTVDQYIYDMINNKFIPFGTCMTDMEDARVRLSDIDYLMDDPHVIFKIAEKAMDLNWTDFSQKHWAEHSSIIDDSILNVLPGLHMWKFDLKKVKSELLRILPDYHHSDKPTIATLLNNWGVSKAIFREDIVGLPFETPTTTVSQVWFYDMWKSQNSRLIEMGLTEDEIRGFKLIDEMSIISDTDTLPDSLKTKSEVYRFISSFRQSGDYKKDSSKWWHLSSVPLIPEQIKVKISEFQKLGIPRNRVDDVKKELCKLFYKGELTNNGYSILKAAGKIWEGMSK